MELASQAGIAPRLHYADAQAGVAIMEYVSEQPLQEYPGGPPMLARDVAALLAKLHATSLFPAVVDFRHLIRRMLMNMLAAGELVPGSLQTSIALGKMCLAGFASELRAAGYEESLACASELA
jgi:hypothetical protein